MKILVTGAAGFIGRHLIPALLKEGYEVLPLDLPDTIYSSGLFFNRLRLMQEYNGKFDLFLGMDITDHSLTQTLSNKLKFDAVIHLAAMAAPNIAEANPEITFRVNVQGTYNILQMAKAVKAKQMIFLSTAHVYGISPKYMPTDERHPLALQDTYTSSKIIGEQLCELFYQNHNIRYITLRLFNGYGPEQSTDYFIPAMLRKATYDNRIILKGQHITKDFVYIDDIIDAIIKALQHTYVGPLNVGTGIENRLGDVAGIIAKAFNVELIYDDSDRRSGPTRMQCDPTRIKHVLNWEPKTFIVEGLEKTIEAWRKRKLG